MNVLCKRILPGIFMNYDSEKFLEWQGNMCKQAAVVGSYVIQEHLPDDYVKVEAWEGFFNDTRLGDYNHCWNYIIHKDDPKKNIICDFTSTISYMNYCSENDPTLHIVSNLAAVNKAENFVTMIGATEINVEEEFKQPEFYTGLLGDAMKLGVTQLLKEAKLW